MKKNKKVGIIGHFGGNENILDGQTIKTKILYDELSKTSNWSIIKADTYYKKKNPIRLVLETIKVLFSTKDIIVLLSGNGMKFYFPLLSVCSKLFGHRIYHDVIGGNLDSYVENNPKFKKYLSSFVVNWVETNSMKMSLEKRNIQNCEVMPNFKRLNIVKVQENVYNEPYRFCIFSRVMKEKGIEDAISAINEINCESKTTKCELDIYGRIDDTYKERFEKIMKNCTSSIKYKGTVPFDKSAETLKDYYALLFPTYWHGEGFPGTIVDAFAASLPVIATDWSCNGEIIINKENGILYPNSEIPDLKTAINWLVSSSDVMSIMKRKCTENAIKYQPDMYIKRIIERIGK